jgi:hypothetical protein
MVGPVVMRADQNEIVEFGGSAVLPVHDVMCMKTTSRPATRDDAAAVAVFEDAA